MICMKTGRRNPGAIRLMSAKTHCQLPTGGHQCCKMRCQVLLDYRAGLCICVTECDSL